ncbi:hypothetical protein [Metasolibacillus sp.]|uniref:hypothetical protein n=1 Tax=Metasolibacillus sp. TaxID=2703680 RepID=UPI0025F6CA73|nr:hypothetical protein [Metasolibacillus sp.]MCT6925857.1 hypothetical protein [Metasolibacillus sp.]MCT6942014.1 hypothetical protein [Metasolibacillus sp.]
MKIEKDNCFEAILSFSKTYNITPPKDLDCIEIWWESAMNQLDDRDIKLFYIAFKIAFKNDLLNGEITSMMFNELEIRVSGANEFQGLA